MTEHKTLFSGIIRMGKKPPGAVSQIPPLSTDVRKTDASVAKNVTTVGLDYGEFSWTTAKSCIFIAPLAINFDFMWQISSLGALGLIILIDNR